MHSWESAIDEHMYKAYPTKGTPLYKMAGIYLPLTKFILMANQITVNLTREGVISNSFADTDNGVIADSSNTIVTDGQLPVPPDAVYSDEDSVIWDSRQYPFDTGGDYGCLSFKSVNNLSANCTYSNPEAKRACHYPLLYR
uniref:C-type lectin domain-containing protein n=1 Tax=Panagrellus redivivus TaxID=6233 RepID=A0A7E4W5R6_PANRE